MKVLCTHPGRFGDLLWALPTVRALSESLGVSIDLHTTGEFATILPLLRLQPYLGTCTADPDWPLMPPAEWQPPRLPRLSLDADYDRVYHLGYRGWPQRPLPFEVAATLRDAYGLALTPDLSRPWITVPFHSDLLNGFVWAEGWTGYWFELKLGLYTLLQRRFWETPSLNLSADARWRDEANVYGPGWITAARWLAGTRVFVGDCSALHVLAVAMGIPAILCEPMQERLNPIFWPLGMDGPQVTVVKGNDGKPTSDARHLGDLLEPYVKGVVPIRA